MDHQYNAFELGLFEEYRDKIYKEKGIGSQLAGGFPWIMADNERAECRRRNIDLIPRQNLRNKVVRNYNNKGQQRLSKAVCGIVGRKLFMQQLKDDSCCSVCSTCPKPKVCCSKMCPIYIKKRPPPKCRCKPLFSMPAGCCKQPCCQCKKGYSKCKQCPGKTKPNLPTCPQCIPPCMRKKCDAFSPDEDQIDCTFGWDPVLKMEINYTVMPETVQKKFDNHGATDHFPQDGAQKRNWSHSTGFRNFYNLFKRQNKYLTKPEAFELAKYNYAKLPESKKFTYKNLGTVVWSKGNIPPKRTANTNNDRVNFQQNSDMNIYRAKERSTGGLYNCDNYDGC